MRENYKYLLCEIKKVAMDSFETFLNRLGLDISLFEHLHDIKYSIGKTINKDAFAEYFQDDNEMVISEKQVKNGFLKLKNGQITYDELVENVAISYLHEMLHANRSIIIANILNIRTYDEFTYRENYNLKHKEELIKYRKALDNILLNYDVNDFVGSIPILVQFNSDKSFTVVAYNNEKHEFEIYEKQFFKVKLNNREKFLFTLSKELLEEKKKHLVSRVVYNYFDYNDVIALPCDYYRYYDNLDLNIKNIKQLKYLEKKIKSIISFEEIITEALAVIIIFSREDEEINYEDLMEYTFDENVYAGIEIIKSLDDDTLRWFLLSSYDEVYYDMFSKIFAEKYNELLRIMYKIYELERPLTNELEKELKFIVKTKTNKQK